jgi:hypothetical protein
LCIEKKRGVKLDLVGQKAETEYRCCDIADEFSAYVGIPRFLAQCKTVNAESKSL